MAEPVIVFNNGSGSDTIASGAGPGTPVNGTGAAHTNGASSTTITLTNSPDLSAVATDGSAAIWLATASGRRWSKITGVDDGADTVTTEDSFNIASGSAVDYGIGGKRKTLDSSRELLGGDIKDEWAVELEDDQTVTTSAISIDVERYSIGSSVVGTERTITQSANAAVFDFSSGTDQVVVHDLKFQNSNGTKSSAYGVIATTGGSSCEMRFERCTFGDSVNTLNQAFDGACGQMMLCDCEILECTGAGIDVGL